MSDQDNRTRQMHLLLGTIYYVHFNREGRPDVVRWVQ
jgi:hypothetical protein